MPAQSRHVRQPDVPRARPVQKREQASKLRFGGNKRPPTGEVRKLGEGKVWRLVDGQPHPLDLKTGLSDGRNTEISGEGVAEGLVVITSSVTKS